MAENLPANQGAERQQSPADRQRHRMDALMAAVESRSEMLEKLLADTGITFDRFLEVFRRALIRNTDLLECDAGSVIEACINACTDGLLPDGRQGAIVVYNVNVANRRKREPDKWVKKANWQPMYQGLLDIAYSSGNFRSIEARPVYDGDHFEYQLGDNPFINHRPKARPAGAPDPLIVAAYAVAKTTNGGVFREVFEGRDIEKVNAVSRAINGPGAKWPEEMARKGPLRRMWKFLPKNEAMNRVVERDNEAFDLEALELPATSAPAAPKLSAGFGKPDAKPALTQSADPVMDIPMDPVTEGMEPDFPGDRAPAKPAAAKQAPPPEPESDAGGDVEPAPWAKTPEGAALASLLASAQSWLNVKQALKTFSKTALAADDRLDRIARTAAWQRMVELRAEGKDKTDFAADPLLFECWLLGVDPEPSPEAVAGNWAIIQQDKAWEKLGEEERARISTRVAEMLPEPDGEP